jgi:hypothetical protein
MKASTFEKQISALKRERNAAHRRANTEERERIKLKQALAELTVSSLNLVGQRDAASAQEELLRVQLNEVLLQLGAERSVWKNLAKALTTFIQTGIEKRKQRLVNWFMVQRLNKQRVEAVTQAGYIPTKLIKLAHKYWEHDQQRLAHDEQIVWHTSTDYTHYSRPPSLWRKLKIIMGRA